MRKREKPVIIYIAVPVDDGARHEFWTSLMGLITNASDIFGKHVSFRCQINPGDSLITRSRNNLAHSFLKSDADYLLFLDTDLDFSHEDIKRLVDHRKEDAIVCGQYAIKQPELRMWATCARLLGGTITKSDRNAFIEAATDPSLRRHLTP